ncbi:uncharacterized protein stard9 isoform X3 [Pristis pectinata]|uniref:uncharacterized protein stard9 isoform X3 n=1 Tax=Pristis pectinata TaxID=685728 RepID=UPI00223D634A|nr:uncharacterized protein stard9 isoform X3 [Pristis pectinata]
MANVKVAVRVRPLSKRELAEGSSIIVKVDDKIASIRNVKLDPRVDSPGDSRQRNMEFTFDYCYWSVDSDSANFAPQELVYQDLGTSVLSGAIEGYNVCLFAYGQTGSGKTYTMMGTPAAIGLTPRICKGLFSRVDDYQEKPASCSIEVSFLEIYNERVRDLLKRCEGNKPYTLRVREHPEKGPYVQGLSQHLVSDYKQLVQLLEEGIANRITAATHIHDASSRSHAIFTIHYTQAILENNLPSEIVSKINLVDLAGSERADPNYSKDRITEGSNINKSLVTLGIVISTLAQNSQISNSCQSINTVMSEGDSGSHSSASSGNSRRQYYVPYRDSVLTWLLKDSLGGNSKTIMIATISPASTSYTETISTLRYAAHAKNIVNKPHVNEDANVKLIRELREEIDRLKAMLMSFGLRNLSPSSDENDEKDGSLTEILLQNELKVDQLTKDWTDRWKDTKAIMEEYYVNINRRKTGVIVVSQLPHLIAVDEDILSTGVSLYHLREGITKIGRIDAEAEQDIVLQGPWVEKEHCIIHNANGVVTLEPIGGSQCIVNELDVVHSCRLSQGAVIVLGKVHKFRFNHPTEAAKLRQRRASSSISLASSGSCEWLDLDGEFSFSPPYVLSPLMQASLEHDMEIDEEMEINETRRQLRELRQCYQSKQQEHEGYKQKLRGLEMFYQEQIHQQQCYVEELRQRIQATQSRAEQELKHDQEQLKLRIEENKQRLANEEKRLVCLEHQRQELGIQTDSASFTECGVQISSQVEGIPFIEQDRKRLVQLELLQRHSLRKAERNIRKKRVKYQLERIAEKHKLLEAKTNLQHLEAASLLSKKQHGRPIEGKGNSLQTDMNPKLARWNKSFPPSSFPMRRHSLSVPFLTRRHSDSGDLVSHLYLQHVPIYSDFLKRKNLSTSTQMKNTTQKSLSVGSLPKMTFPITRKQALKGGSEITSPFWDQLQKKHKGIEHKDVKALKQSTESSQEQPKILELSSVQPEVQISNVSKTRIQKSDVMACSLDGQSMLELTDEDVKEDLPWNCSFVSTGNNLSPMEVCKRTPPKQLVRTRSFCTVNQGQHLVKGASMVNLAHLWGNVPGPCETRKWNSEEILNAKIAAVPDDSLGDWLGEGELSDTDSLYSVDSLSSAYANAITEQLQKDELEEQQSKQQENCSESDDSEMSQDSLADKDAISADAFQDIHCGRARLSPNKTRHKLANRGKSMSLDSLADMGETSVLFRMDSPGLTAADEMPAEVYWNLPWNDVDEKETYQNPKVLIEEKECVGALTLKEQCFNMGSNTELKDINCEKNTHLENLKPNKNYMDLLILPDAQSSNSKSNMERVSSDDTSVLAISSGGTDGYGNARIALMKEAEASQITSVFNFDPFQPKVIHNLHQVTALTTCKECHASQNANNRGMLDREEDLTHMQEIYLRPSAATEVTMQSLQCTDHNMACITGVLSTAEVKTKSSLTNISAEISNVSDCVYSARQSCSLIESEEFILSSTSNTLKLKTFSTDAVIDMKGADSEMEVTEQQYKNTKPERSCRQSQHNQLSNSDYHRNYDMHGSASEVSAAKLNFSSNFETRSISGTEQFISPREELSCCRQSHNMIESQIISSSSCTPVSNSSSLTTLVAKPLSQLLDPKVLEICAADVEKDPGTQRLSFNDRLFSFTEENNDIDSSLSVENMILAPLAQNKTKPVLEGASQDADYDTAHSTSMKNGISRTDKSSLVHEGNREAQKHFIMWQHSFTTCAKTKDSKADPFTSFIMKQQSVAQTNLSRNESNYTSTETLMSSQMDSEIKVSEPITVDGHLCMKDSVVCSEGIQLRTSDSQVQGLKSGTSSDEKEEFDLKGKSVEKAISISANNPNGEECLNYEHTPFFGGTKDQKCTILAEETTILNLPVSGQNAASSISEQPTESAVGTWNRFHPDSNFVANSDKPPNNVNFSAASVSRHPLPQCLIKETEQINKQGDSESEISLGSNTHTGAVTECVVCRLEISNPQGIRLGFKTEIDRPTLDKEGGINQNNTGTELRVQVIEDSNTRAEKFTDDNTSTLASTCGFEDCPTVCVSKSNASQSELKRNKMKNNALPGGISTFDSSLPVDFVGNAGFYKASKEYEVNIEEQLDGEGASKNAPQRTGGGTGETVSDVECDQKEITCAELTQRDNIACDCPEQNKSNENSAVNGGAVQVVNSSGATHFQRTFVQTRISNAAETDAYVGTTSIDLADSSETCALSAVQEIRTMCSTRIGNEQNEIITTKQVNFEKLSNDEGRAFEGGTEVEGQGVSEDFNSSKYYAEQTCTKDFIIENDCTVGRAFRERSLSSDCTCTESSYTADASRVPFRNEVIGTGHEAGQAKEENSTIAQNFLMENEDHQALHLETVQSIETDSNQSQSKCGYKSHQKGDAGELIQKNNPVHEIESKVNVSNTCDINCRTETVDHNHLLFKVVDCTADAKRGSTEPPCATIKKGATNITELVETISENNDIKGSAKSKNSIETRNGAEQSGSLLLIYNDEGAKVVTSLTKERLITHVGTDNRSKQNHSPQVPSVRPGEDTKSTDKIMDTCLEKPHIRRDILTRRPHSGNPSKLRSCTFDNQEILNWWVSLDVAQRSDLHQEEITAVRGEVEHGTDEYFSSKIPKSVKSEKCKSISNNEEQKVSPEEVLVRKKSNPMTFQEVEMFESVLRQESTDQCEASLATALWDDAAHSLRGQEHSQVERLENSGTMDSRATPGSPSNGITANSGTKYDMNNATTNQYLVPVEHFPVRARQNHRWSTESLQLELAESRAFTDGYMCSKGIVLLQHREQSPSQPAGRPLDTTALQPNKDAVEREDAYSGVEAPQSCFVLKAGPEVNGGDCQINQPISSTEGYSTPVGSDSALLSQDIVLKEVIGRHVIWCHPDRTTTFDASDFQADQQTVDIDQAMFGPQHLRKNEIEMLVHVKQKSPAKNMFFSGEDIANSDTVDATASLNICKGPTCLHYQNTGILATGLNVDLKTDNISVCQNMSTMNTLLPQSKVFQNQTEFQRRSLQDVGGSYLSGKCQAVPGSFAHQHEELDVSSCTSSRAVLLKQEGKQSQNASRLYFHTAIIQTALVENATKTAIVPGLAGLSSLESRLGAETTPATKNQVFIQQGDQQVVQMQPTSPTVFSASDPLKAETKCHDVQFSNGDSVDTFIPQSFTGSSGHHKQAELHCRSEEDYSMCLIERDSVGLELTENSSNLCVMSEQPKAIHLVNCGEEFVTAEFMALPKAVRCDTNCNDKDVFDSTKDLIRKEGSGIEDWEETQALLKRDLIDFKEMSSDAESHYKNQGILADVKEENKSQFPTKIHKGRYIGLSPSAQEILDQEKPRLLQQTQNHITPECELGNESILQRKDLNNTSVTLAVTETHNRMSSQINDLQFTQTDGSQLNVDVDEQDAHSLLECKQIRELGSHCHESNKCKEMDGTFYSTDSSLLSDSCHSACSGQSSVTQVNELNTEGLGSSGSECLDGSDVRCATKMRSGPKKKSHRLRRIKPKPNIDATKGSSSSSEEVDIEFLSLNELRSRQCRRGINRSHLNVCKCKDSVSTTSTNLGSCVLNLKMETKALSLRLLPPVVQEPSSSVNLMMEGSSGHCLDPLLIAKPSDELTPRAASPIEEGIVYEMKHEAKDVGRKNESKQSIQHKIVGECVSGHADSHVAACTETDHSMITLPCNRGQGNQSDKQQSDYSTSLMIDNNLNNFVERKLKAQEFSEVDLTFSDENDPMHFAYGDVHPYIHQQCNKLGRASLKQCTLENASSMCWVQPKVSCLSNVIRCSSDSNGLNDRNSHSYANARTISSTLSNVNDLQKGNLATMHPENDYLDEDTCVIPCDPPVAPSFTQSSQFPTSTSELENMKLQVDEMVLLYPRDLGSSVEAVSDGPVKLTCNKETQTSGGMRYQKLSAPQRSYVQTPTQTYTSQSPQAGMENLSVHLSKLLHNTTELLGNIRTNKDHSDPTKPSTNQNTSKLGEVSMTDGYTQTATDVATQTETLPQVIEKYSQELQNKEVQRSPEVNVIVKVIGSEVNVNQDHTNLTLTLQKQKQNYSVSDPNAHCTALSHSVCSSPSENANSSFRTSTPALLPAQKMISSSSQTASSSPGLSPVTASSQISMYSDQTQGTSFGSLESTSEFSKMETNDLKLSENREVKQFAQGVEAALSANVNPAVLVDRASSPIKTLEAGLGNHRYRSKSFLCLQGQGACALQCTGYWQRKARPASWYGSNEKQQSKIYFTQVKPEAEQILETNGEGPLAHSNEQSKVTSQGLPMSVKLECEADFQRDVHTEGSSMSSGTAESCKDHHVNVSAAVEKSSWQCEKELTGHIVKESSPCNKGIEPYLASQKVQMLCTSNPDGRRQMNALSFQPSCQKSPLVSFPLAQINDDTVWPFPRSPSTSSIQHNPFSKDWVDFQEEKASMLHDQIRHQSDAMNHCSSESGTYIMSEMTNECVAEDAQSFVSSECNTDLLLNEYPSITGCNSSQASDSRAQGVSCRGPEDLPLHNKFHNWSGVNYRPPSTASLMSTATGSHRQTEQEQKQTSSDVTETMGLKSEDHEARQKEIESLRQERTQILSGLNLELNQHQLTVELAEAKLNYGLGETDALLRMFQSGAADDQNVCIRQQLYDRHMKTIEILRKERDEKIQKFRRTRSLSPQKHLTIHHQKHTTALHHEQDLPSKRRTYLQRLRQDIVENTRTRAVVKAPQETPSEIEILLRDYQKAREETKAEIAKARDKLRARAEKEKCRLQQEIILQLLKEERLRKVASRSSLHTGSNLSLSSNPTSGYSSSHTASPDTNSQTKNKSSTDPVMTSRGCPTCCNSQIKVTEVIQHFDAASCPRAHSISGRITKGSCHPSSTYLKKYQDLAALAVASVTAEIMVASVNCPGDLLTGKAAAGWRYHNTEKGVLMFYKHYASSTKHGFMGIGMIEKPLHSVWCVVKDNSKRQLYDKTVRTVKIHRQLGHGIELVYLVINTSTCCLNQPRDFCCISVEAEENQQYILAMQSIYEESMPRPVKDMVRGEMLPSGWILQPDNHNGKEMTRLIYLTQVDLGAPALPPRLLRSLARQQPLCIANLISLLS